MVELPEACDFCELPRDEERDEHFVKLHLGDPPQPQPATSRGIIDDPMRRTSEQQFRALKEALQKMPEVEYEVYDHVQEVKQIGGEPHFSKDPSDVPLTRHESEIAHDKTAAEIGFQPEPREVEPDAMVCQECAEMFRSLGEE